MAGKNDKQMDKKEIDKLSKDAKDLAKRLKAGSKSMESTIKQVESMGKN